LDGGRSVWPVADIVFPFQGLEPAGL
jgi:hypothetical protein